MCIVNSYPVFDGPAGSTGHQQPRQQRQQQQQQQQGQQQRTPPPQQEQRVTRQRTRQQAGGGSGAGGPGPSRLGPQQPAAPDGSPTEEDRCEQRAPAEASAPLLAVRLHAGSESLVGMLKTLNNRS